MCGIVGAVARRHVENVLLQGLYCLEYRGYDSAGIAVFNKESYKIQIVRVKGKVRTLATKLEQNPIKGYIGIAHTRWATHGKPTEKNAHPLCSENVISIVHNGIIENHRLLRKRLIESGYTFKTETDTEVIVHLINYYRKMKREFLQAILQVIQELKGVYALAIISTIKPEVLYAVCYGSPLVVGLGVDEHFIASDVTALPPTTQKFIYLEAGDIAQIEIDAVSIYDQSGQSVVRPSQFLKTNCSVLKKGKFCHFMKKEIFEQPKGILDTISEHLAQKNLTILNSFGHKAESIFRKTERLKIIACGTSFHAALVGCYWLESLSGIPCQAEIASENRYRKVVVEPNTLYIVISQSGETADTLAALRKAKKLGYIATLGICNTPDSTIARESDLVFLTRAGTEVGVAATKTFTTQLVSLLLLSVLFQRTNRDNRNTILTHLQNLPNLLQKILNLDTSIKNLSKRLVDKQYALFLGRGALFPIALEGALKLKEVSYMHAEAYPAGELKHGPLALVDKDIPVIVIASNNYLLEKLESNMQEVQARGGELFVFMDENISWECKKDDNFLSVRMPSMADIISPIAYVVPLQLLAYYVAVLKGTDVDQPRNLAKSVTVE
ncbi:glutamine--fructose-6-phosphate transaminase (isomerizing) [Coxiella endosymbiont of Amblyomma sculptum]|uniref:glutamine--fructose-6-phosphate transaminase (isomerizing) n=1 Tax=Coxiella endosymbiont of Amblyomma sculptum TaxID=2487929 RepID=UPI00132F4F5A|nr:glutamine--fructose-6-phosphate transaminase (isomerizing) [Coxiella endosymbiont of Amblyomma sculptum]QHG92232.1 glutamine--fructose-6-phosphate transaminase (isomerizing) [Coxiella endosymbiont of Amblyomma sculptum]